MSSKVFLCSSSYPERNETLDRIGIDVTDSISGFVKSIGRNEILPFLGAYQRLVYSYFFFKKLIKRYKVDFVLVTGGSSLIPKDIAERTIVYVHYPVDLEVASEKYQSKILKKWYIRPWMFISNNLDYIKQSTIITNSNYTKNAIKSAWGMDSVVIYPPCPQYSFPLNDAQVKEDVVCSIGRFTEEKRYETILEVARRLPDVKFELVGSITPDKAWYLDNLQKNSPKNVVFHINATVDEKIDVLKKSKVMLHGFIGEHFGIAYVEAMSAGIIPVAHDSGAAKIDAIIEEKYRYNNIEEAVDSVKIALSSWSISESQRLREYAKKFSAESFRNNLGLFISKWLVDNGKR